MRYVVSGANLVVDMRNSLRAIHVVREVLVTDTRETKPDHLDGCGRRQVHLEVDCVDKCDGCAERVTRDGYAVSTEARNALLHGCENKSSSVGLCICEPIVHANSTGNSGE